MKKRDTRELILDCALRLFNEEGTAQISTNHICAACKISPGNLYYHFSNKREIINELFRMMIAKWDNQAPPTSLSLESFYGQFELMFTFIWDYRFLHRELAQLIREDDEFEKIFRAVQKKRMAEIDRSIALYARAGVVKKLKRKEAERLRRILWFFSLQWLPFLEMEGREITQSSVRESIRSLQMLLQPFLASA